MATATKRRSSRRPAEASAAQPSGPAALGRIGPTELLPVDRIEPSPWQPRIEFGDIEALAALLREQGQLQPITVRRLAEGAYQLVDGERRWRAARTLGWTGIRAEVLELDDAAARQALLTAGLQHQSFSPIEEARAFRAALDAGDAPGPTELARRLGVSQGHVRARPRHGWSSRTAGSSGASRR